MSWGLSRLICGAALALALSSGPPALAARAKVGKPAPNFTIVTFDGEKIRRDDLNGKVVIINYWATWCGPCKQELPLLHVFRRKFADHGLEVYAITTEDSAPKKQLGALKAVLSFPLASRLDGSGYGILSGVPTNYVIDRSGVVRYAKAGSFDLETLNELLIPLLKEPAAPGN